MTGKSVGSLALVSGAGILDLLLLPSSDGGTFSGNGKKVRIAEFSNPDTNADPITITFGAATPYALLGATFLITLKPGQSTGSIYLADGAPVIGSGAKHIDVAGVGTEVLNFTIVVG